MIKKANKVADDMMSSIGGGRRRHVRVAKAAEVRGYGSEAIGGEEEELMAPWVPELREAMKEEHRRAGADGSNVHIDAIGGNYFVLYVLHFSLLSDGSNLFSYNSFFILKNIWVGLQPNSSNSIF